MDPETNQGTHATPSADNPPEPNPLEGINPEQLLQNPILLAQVTAQLQQNHLHLPVLTPEPETMTRMKAESPEIYSLYVDGIRKSIEADYIQRTYPYTEPLKSTMSGRRYGLVAVIAVLAVALVALVLEHPGFATVIVTIDVVALAAVFGGSSSHNARKE